MLFTRESAITPLSSWIAAAISKLENSFFRNTHISCWNLLIELDYKNNLSLRKLENKEGRGFLGAETINI
jgi:hypothetical protein